MNKLKINILAPGSPFNGNTLRCKSLGGAETATLQLAEKLAEFGHDVTVVNNCIVEGNYNNVKYRHLKDYKKYFIDQEHDVSFVLRHPEVFNNKHNSKINILMQHDLALINDKEIFENVLWNLDACFILSEFHKKQHEQIFGEYENLYKILGNAVDFNLLPKGSFKRDSNKIIYSSRPERGLESLIYDIFPKLLKENPDLKLYITTYDGFSEPVKELQLKLRTFVDNNFKNNVIWLPPQTKTQLYEHFLTSKVLLYSVVDSHPIIGDFAETYCITMDEATMCGLPVVTYPKGAIHEREVSAYWASNENDFIKGTLQILNSEVVPVCDMLTPDWDTRAKQFENWFHVLIENSEKQNNKLSVIVETKNNESTIDRCLKSVSAIADEIVINDKGSNDLTLRIAKKYTSLKLKQPRNNIVLRLSGNEEVLNAPEIVKFLRYNIYNSYKIKKEFIFKEDVSERKITKNIGTRSLTLPNVKIIDFSMSSR